MLRFPLHGVTQNSVGPGEIYIQPLYHNRERTQKYPAYDAAHSDEKTPLYNHVQLCDLHVVDKLVVIHVHDVILGWTNVCICLCMYVCTYVCMYCLMSLLSNQNACLWAWLILFV
jgi:hypothetical protein